ncbi:MAG: type II secretion system protein [Patescibacteria group bacterium]
MEPARTRHRLLADTPMRGFTLVEMLVVLGIMIVITSITILGQSTFNKSLTLTDTAYTVALSVRESQSLGLSGRKVTVAGIPTQNAGYGVYFTEGNTYVQFADIYPGKPGDDLGGDCPGHTVNEGPESRPGNCLYDVGEDSVMKTYRFDRGFNVARFCGESTAGTQYCSDSGSNSITALHVVFLRPNTESSIMGWRSGAPIELVNAEIYIEPAEGGASRGVCISKVGQVAVATSTCSL